MSPRATKSEYAYVYILASKGKRLYIRVTTTIEVRIRQHKAKAHRDSFTAKYNIDQLVYFEHFARVDNAIAREKELKGWLRIRKVELIISSNPDWRDLSLEWGHAVEPFREPSRLMTASPYSHLSSSNPQSNP